MPSGDAVPQLINNLEQAKKMEKRRNHLDNLFELALVLLGILIAVEFHYYLTLSIKTTDRLYVLNVVTVPFIIIIGVWLIKELFKNFVSSELKMLLTEFCWGFWSFTLLNYLLMLTNGRQYNGLQIGIIFPLVLSLFLIFSIRWSYFRTYLLKKENVKMFKYFRSIRWTFLWWIIFVIVYILITIIVLPWGL